MRYFILSITLLSLVGCSTGVTKPVSGKIIKIGKEYAPMSCVGKGTHYTVVKLQDNHVATLCGDYGNVGDKISGYWFCLRILQ